MEGRLSERVALVTGAASGIGLATAQRLAQEGATVVGMDVNTEAPVADFWAGRRFLVVDVRDGAAVDQAVTETVDTHGRLDIVVNAAGVAGGGPVHMVDEGEWDRVLDVNLKGTFLVCRQAVRSMLASGAADAPPGGRSIINIASIEGIEGTEGGSAYNASKAGVVMLTKNMALDYGRRGIRTNCICPGFIETPMTAALFKGEFMDGIRDRFKEAHALGRFGFPGEIAAAAAFLASDDASFVSGHALVVDGGLTAGARVGITELLGLA